MPSAWSWRADLIGEAAVKDGGVPVRLVGVNGSRFHGAVGMFGDDVAACFDIGADQHGLELAGEAGSLSNHCRRLLGHADHDVAV